MATCSLLAQESDLRLVLSTYNVSEGVVVHIGCRKFGQRLIGPQNVTCLSDSQWSDTAKPKCAWTGELNTYEKLVIAVAASCFILLLIYVFVIISIVTTRKSKKQRERELEDVNDMETPYAINQNVEHAYYDNHKYPLYRNDARESGPYKNRISTGNNRYSGSYKTKISYNGYGPYQEYEGRDRNHEGYPEHRNHNGADMSGRGYGGEGNTSGHGGEGNGGYYYNKAYDDRDRLYTGNRNAHDDEKRDYRWKGHIPRPHIGSTEAREAF